MKNFQIPLLFFLILIISKEIFSYDSEKVVVLCILTFITLIYFNFKEMLSNTFHSQSLKIKEEFELLLEEKILLEKQLRRFWRIFLDLEDQLIEIFYWIKINIIKIIKKMNIHRKFITFYIIKDQLNLIVNNYLKTLFFFNKFYLNKSIYNIKYNWINKLNVFSNNFYINKINNITSSFNNILFIFNKLGINKNIDLKHKIYNYNTIILLWKS